MKDNNIEILKTKYFFIGLIVGIFPFLILLLILNQYSISNIYKMTIIIISIVVSIMNGYILKHNVNTKIKESLN